MNAKNEITYVTYLLIPLLLAAAAYANFAP